MRFMVHPDTPFTTSTESTYKSGFVVQTTGATSVLGACIVFGDTDTGLWAEAGVVAINSIAQGIGHARQHHGTVAYARLTHDFYRGRGDSFGAKSVFLLIGA